MSLNRAVSIRCPWCRRVAVEIWVEPLSGRRFEIRSDEERAQVLENAPETVIDEMARNAAAVMSKWVVRTISEVLDGANPRLVEQASERTGHQWCLDHSDPAPWVLSIGAQRTIDAACRPIDGPPKNGWVALRMIVDAHPAPLVATRRPGAVHRSH